jgi:hypothetical protein
MSVHGFLPSTYALHFPNDFPPAPIFLLGLGRGGIGIGNAANGLCGGMAFAARDQFEQGSPAPSDHTPPARGTPLFRYLVRRLFASFDLPWGPFRYWFWMALPTGDWGSTRGLAGRTARKEWPKVKADIDRGVLSPLGLIRTRALNPLSLGLNHQVLVYGYRENGEAGTVVLAVYDPNHPDEDGLSLAVRLFGPHRGVEYVGGELPVRGFFRTRYRPPGARSRRLLERARGSTG